MIRARANMAGFERFRTTTQAAILTDADLRGPLLTEFGQVHRKQQAAIFTSEGKAGAGGKFSALNPSYAQRKRKAVGRKKILQLTGNMKARFTGRSNPSYVQEYVPRGQARGVFRFGARSDVAAAHFYGNPGLAAAGARTGAAKKLFGGVAKRLPVRDMVSKTPQMFAEFRAAAKAWYIKRVQQITRHRGRSR